MQNFIRDETKYLNLNITNPSISDNTPLIFKEYFNVPFVIPQDYKLVIVRFHIPNFETPIFNFVDGAYKISMSYKGTIYTRNVTWAPRSTDITSRKVFEIQHFIDMCNATIMEVQDLLNSGVTGPLPYPTAYPYYTYDEPTELISLRFFDQNIDSATYPISVYVNNLLMKMLYGIPTTGTGILHKEWRYVLLPKDNIITTGVYFTQQQAPSFDLMCDFNSVIFTSSIPTSPEYTGSADKTLMILNDYMLADLNAKTFNNDIVYNSTFPYRTIDMHGQTPITSIIIQCYISDKAGILTLNQLPPMSSASMKLMFIHV